MVILVRVVVLISECDISLSYQDGKPVNDKLSKYFSFPLSLNKLTSEDSGLYTCAAINSLGKSEFSIQLEITGEDFIFFRKTNTQAKKHARKGCCIACSRQGN